MRKLLIKIVILVVLLVGGGLVWLAMNANSLLAKHRGDIENALSDTLKSKVTLGAMSATVFPSTAVQISDLNLGGGFSLTNVRLKLSPLALLGGTLKINELSIDDPSIVLVQGPDGLMVKGIALPAKAEPAKLDTTHKPAVNSPSSPVALALESFALRNGSVTIESKPPAKPLHITEINLSSGFGASGSDIKLSNLQGSVTAMGHKFGTSATSIKANAATSAVVSDGLVLKTPGGDINVALNVASSSDGKANIATSSPLSLKGFAGLASEFAPVVKNLGGQVNLNLNANFFANPGDGKTDFNHGGDISLSGISASVAPFDVSGLNSKIGITGNSSKHEIRSEALNLTLNDQNLESAFTADFDQAASRASLSRFNLKGFGGTVSATGDTVLKENGPLNFNFEASGLALNRLLGILKSPALAAVEGTINHANAKIASVNGPAMLTKLDGNLNFDVRDGSLPGINIIAPVIKALSALPILTGKAVIPPSLQAAADSPNTAFKVISGSFQIADGLASTNDLFMSGVFFDLKGRGSFTTAGAVNLSASIFFAPNISTALAGKESNKILDKDGRLEVPLTISGQPGAFRVVPDLNRLLQTAAGAALQEGAAKFLDKAFSKKGKRGGLFGF